MPLRVGIAGAGTTGEIHAAAWRNAGAELSGCTSLRRAQSEDLGRRYGMVAYPDYQELLKQVDIVDVCTPTPLHRLMVVEAAAGLRLQLKSPGP